nr:MAG TPA: hypothetical protein [Caudoviricetes sp.]
MFIFLYFPKVFTYNCFTVYLYYPILYNRCNNCILYL